MLARLADLTWRRPRLVLAAVAVLAVGAAAFGHDAEHRLKPAGFTDPASQSERAKALLKGALGHDPDPAIIVLVRPRGRQGILGLGSPRMRAEIDRLATELGHAKHVGKVINPLTDRGAARALIERDHHSLVLVGDLDTGDLENLGGEAAKDAKRKVRSSLLDVGLTGYAPAFQEVNDQTRKDLTHAELIAFPVLALMLLIVFRSLVAAAVPLVLGGLSIVGTFLVLRVMSEFTSTSLFALNIATALSLGLGVDYALLMVSRYREELARGLPPQAAHRRMVTSAGRAALFSGGTVAVGMAALVLMPQRFLYSVGAAGAAVGLLSACLAVLVVPASVAWLGPRLDALTVRRRRPAATADDRWTRLARGVMRRPVVVALGTTAVLLALAAPLLGTVLTGPSAKAIPRGQSAYEPNEYVQSHYPRAVSEGVTVAVDGRAGAAGLAALRGAIARVPGVAVAPPFTQAAPGVAYTTVGLRAPALDAGSQDAVRAIRHLPPPPGTRTLVAGNTARFIDEKRSLVTNAPKVVGIVAAATLLVLFALTGSILLPLKTLLMNAITLAATLGVIVLAFQHAWLAGPLDYPGPDAVEVTSLVFLFAVTFALATDYAVLVMARIKEHHDRGEANADAVAHGIGMTGRIISAAAMMIAVVFLAFAVSPVFFMKQIAVGMAAGVLIDATIVRGLLVPALMRLLGERNWWAPRPLRRLHERLRLGEAVA